METTQSRSNRIIILLGLAALVLLGFALRHLYLQRMILHVDEFLTLLATKMILEKGVPVLPTNIFHGKGLVFNYLGAGTASIFQFSLETIRYQSLVIGLVTIPVVYWVALKLYSNRWAAFMSAAILAVLPEAILWGGRARMYSMAQLAVFVVILVSWLCLSWYKTNPKYLILLPVATLGMLLSHLVTIVVLPPLLLAMVVTHYLLNKPEKKEWRWLIFLGVILVIVSALGYWIGREPGEMRQWQEESSLVGNIIRATFNLRLLDNFQNYFLFADNIGLTVLTFIGLGGLLFKTTKLTLNKTDIAGLFINLQLFTIFLELYIIIPSNIRDERHNFVVLTPYLILGAAYGVLTIINLLQRKWGSINWLAPAFCAVLLVGLIVPQLTSLNILLVKDDPETYRYDEAMALVDEKMAPGDQLLTVWPPAAYLYGRPADFYANQHKPRYTKDLATGQLIEYFSGGNYLANVEDFYATINQPGRLWFVTDDIRLTRNYNEKFSQEILNQMALTGKIGNMLIFRERDNPWVMAETPDIVVDAEFKNQMRLTGYSTELNGTDLRMTLFWEPLDPVFNYKVFVHLRDQNGNTVAQADFAPYDHVINMSKWHIAWDDEDIFPTGTVLSLPPELLGTNPDQYRLFIGLYVEELNFERVPVVNDISGENAVILTDLGL